MKAILFSQDLMFSGRVSSAAAAVGAEFSDVMSTEHLLELASDGCDLVILDLATSKVAIGIEDIVAKLKAIPEAPRVLAYGPHVQEANLAAATAAGCDQVMTRGQFSQNLSQLFAP
jgi:DNA-binding NarL/FixJ family response regulator